MVSAVESSLDDLHGHCINVRLKVVDQADVAGGGHYGSCFSCVEILVALYYGFLRVRPAEPTWADRDRFILSKGHATSALYPILAELGYFDPALLGTFTRLGSRLGDHPDMRKVPGVDFSSGSLGHGLSVAVGMAEGASLRRNGARVAVLLGDGELNEGQIWEAAAYAAHRRLANLVAIVDVNGVCVDGDTRDVLNMEPLDDKWRSFGWLVERLDGHDMPALLDALRAFARRHESSEDAPPTVLIADTVAGRGVSFMEGTAEWHLGYLHGEDRARAVRDIQAMYPVTAAKGARS